VDTPVRYAIDPWVATVTQGSTYSNEGVSTGNARSLTKRKHLQLRAPAAAAAHISQFETDIAQFETPPRQNRRTYTACIWHLEKRYPPDTHKRPAKNGQPTQLNGGRWPPVLSFAPVIGVVTVRFGGLDAGLA
jgi:hypothetical protein